MQWNGTLCLFLVAREYSPSNPKQSKDCSDIKEAAIPKQAKLFTYVESEKYDGKLAVRLELRDENGAVRESTVTAVEHTISVLENISPEKRERKIIELVHSLVNELDDRMRKNVKEHLSGYVSYSPPLLTTGE